MIAEPKSGEKEQPQKANEPIFFKRGIPGLGKSRWFTLHLVEGNPFFYYLQSVEDRHTGLFLVDPFPCFPEYILELSPQDIEELEVENKEDVLVFTTVTLLGDGRMTTNLAAPLVINARKKVAKQLIIPERIGEMRTPLPLQD